MQQQGGKEKFQVHQPPTVLGFSCTLGQDPAATRGMGWARGWKGDKQRRMGLGELPRRAQRSIQINSDTATPTPDFWHKPTKLSSALKRQEGACHLKSLRA